ncbi:unnamed protein product, partial [Mesorhabditis spiculigera]
KSPIVLDPVIEELDLQTTARNLAGRIQGGRAVEYHGDERDSLRHVQSARGDDGQCGDPTP